MLEFENVLRQLGSFGPYQRRVFILVSMFETPVAWAMLLPIFLNVVPEWKCPDTSNASLVYNSSFTSNISFPLSINVKKCSESGLLCPEASFTKEIQTIVSEVGESENYRLQSFHYMFINVIWNSVYVILSVVAGLRQEVDPRHHHHHSDVWSLGGGTCHGTAGRHLRSQEAALSGLFPATGRLSGQCLCQFLAIICCF